ncbi:uncharacterized protein LOC114257030 isoform X2 [Camellia sinensis]|uniref:uncharacterized protein LOC114257030 isoform X2 n=1 Tax=Camellia sinensis TaxID=4442 RepID=UPI001036453C|nr:uncharacterized protein LOC114257030 isoform X2 [Camellia sinensis]
MLYVPTGVAAAAVCGKGCAATAVCPKGVVAALTDGTQDSMYIPVPQDEPYYFPCMDGTHDSMYVSAGVSTIQMADNIRSTSHTRSGMVNNISSQSSTVVSKFVDLNINADSNAPFFFVF